MSKIQTYAAHVVRYQNPQLQQKALSCIPLEQLRQQARVSLTLSTTASDRRELEDELICQLLSWFKSWFSWVDKPACEHCQNTATQFVSTVLPTAEESRGLASNVELYECTLCHGNTRFPRFNDPSRLLDTRKGRCGEWANAFAALCVALGYDTRFVVDWSDHVWVEVWTPSLQRWVHCDPCENAYDTPLMYESGWGKRLSYVLGFGQMQFVDVTKRYTRKWNEVLSRRTIVAETWLETTLSSLNSIRLSQCSKDQAAELRDRTIKEAIELESAATLSTSLKFGELQSRQSGAQEWKEARGENGPRDCGDGNSRCSVPQIPSQPVGAPRARPNGHQLFECLNFSNSAIKLVGDAFLSHEGSRIRLTSAKPAQRGACWKRDKVPIRAGFATQFRFQITQPGADGLAFVIQNHAVDALGGDGCNLGFGGIPKSIAIEIDTFQTWDRCADPNANHICVLTRGIEPNSPHHSYSLGCTTNATNMPRLADGNIHTVNIAYFDNCLEIQLDGNPVLNVVVNIVDILKLNDADGLVWVGFTASTGGLCEDHDILSWSFDVFRESSGSKVFPLLKSFMLFETGNTKGITEKLNKFCDRLLAVEATKEMAMTEQEKQIIKETLAATLPGGHIPESAFSIFTNKLLRWPEEFAFPVLDAARLAILHPDSMRFLASHSEEARTLLLQILHFSKNGAPYANRLMVCRCIANYFQVSPSTVEQLQQKIFDCTIDLMDSSEEQLRHTFVAVLANFSLLFVAHMNEEGKAQALSSLVKMFHDQVENPDSKDLLTMLAAIGTLVINDRDCAALAHTLDLSASLGKVISTRSDDERVVTAAMNLKNAIESSIEQTES